MDLVYLMSNPRTNTVFAGPFEVLHGYSPRSCLSHDHSCTLTLPASLRRGPLRDSTEDRRIGLNTNYSFIFTEISFFPETSILLQIIQIIHMILWIMPEFDREGRAVCQFWLQGGKLNVTPTDKSQPDESHLGDLRTQPPPPLRKGGDYKVPRKTA